MVFALKTYLLKTAPWGIAFPASPWGQSRLSNDTPGTVAPAGRKFSSIVSLPFAGSMRASSKCDSNSPLPPLMTIRSPSGARAIQWRNWRGPSDSLLTSRGRRGSEMSRLMSAG